MKGSQLKKILTFICIWNVLSVCGLSAGIIQDAVLEESIIKYFPDGKVSMTNLRNLKELEVENKKIASLEGLSHCSNLEKITFIGCGIEDISALSSLKKLKYLDINNNPVKSIEPLRKLANLELLRIARFETNSLSALSNLNNLKELSISSDSISDISLLSKLKNLEILRLGLMPLHDISPISDMQNLRVLTVVMCNIEDIEAVDNLANIEELHLRFNNINDIKPIANLHKLQKLKLTSNCISDISPLTKLCNLQEIDLEKNPLSDTYPKFKEIIISNNPNVKIADEQLIICRNLQVAPNGEFVSLLTGLFAGYNVMDISSGRLQIVNSQNGNVHSVNNVGNVVVSCWSHNENNISLYFAAENDLSKKVTNIRRCCFQDDGSWIVDDNFNLEFEAFLISGISVSPGGKHILASKWNGNMLNRIDSLLVWNNSKKEFTDTNLFITPRYGEPQWLSKEIVLVLNYDNLLQITLNSDGEIVERSILKSCQLLFAMINSKPVYASDYQIYYGEQLICPTKGVIRVFVYDNHIAFVKKDKIDLYDINTQKMRTIKLEQAFVTDGYNGLTKRFYGLYKATLPQPEKNDNIFAVNSYDGNDWELFYDIKKSYPKDAAAYWQVSAD